jgi:hypothetical protein
VSLTGQLREKGSPVRSFMEREFGDVSPVCREANAAIRDGRAGYAPIASRLELTED